jgi:CheY-like chemotaxis protein
MQGHQVTACSCGQELLYVLLASKSVEHDTTAPYDLLIVDDLLTGVMNGGMVIATIRRWYPAEMLPILFISGANPVDLAKV